MDNNETKSTADTFAEKLKGNERLADTMLDKTWVVNVMEDAKGIPMSEAFGISKDRLKEIRERIDLVINEWMQAGKDIVAGKRPYDSYNGGTHILIQKANAGCKNANEIAYTSFMMSEVLSQLPSSRNRSEAELMFKLASIVGMTKEQMIQEMIKNQNSKEK